MTGQLGGGAFAGGSKLLRTAEALALLQEAFTPLGRARERVAVREALGRILAETACAQRAVPPHDNAAVDGWAFRLDDVEASLAGTRLRCAGIARAGAPWRGHLAAGEAVRVLTGAAMPEGADTIVMEEDCKGEDGATPSAADAESVWIPHGLLRGANRRRRGEDLEAGAVAVPEGRRLRPQDLGQLAACGFAQVYVRPRLRAVVFSTGDELGDELGEAVAGGTGELGDSNRPMLSSLLEGLGCVVRDGGILPDERARVDGALAQAEGDADLVVASGGMSLSEEDHLRRAVAERGSFAFWRLAVKPGRPAGLGHLRNGVAFAGLPGNPVAAFVMFAVLVRPLVLHLLGAEAEPRRGYPLPLRFAVDKKPGRREWLRVRLVEDADGTLGLEPFPRRGAGVLSSLAESDGLVELAEDVTHAAAGSRHPFLPFRGLL